MTTRELHTGVFGPLSPRGSSSSLAKPRLRYRVFYNVPDGAERQCDVYRHRPITDADDVDAIERALMARFGHSNAVIIGWQFFENGEPRDAVEALTQV